MSKSVANAWLVLLARVPALLSQFRTNRAGNTAIIFALSAIPVVAAIGCVTDYSYATMVKTKLQAASDAAALATVSNNSPIVATAKSMSGNGTVAGGPTYIQNFFSADTTAFTGVSATGSTTKSGTTVTATLSYSYNVPTTFMKVLGYPSMALTGSSTASVTVATYIDFYLMLDVSGSMSFPSTAAEQVRLMSVNPDNLITAVIRKVASSPATGRRRTPPARKPGRNIWPPAPQNYTGAKYPITSEWPSGYPGGYCMGFLISRLGTTPAYPTNCVPSNETPPPTNTNDSTAPAKPFRAHPGHQHRLSVGMRPVRQLDQSSGDLVRQSWHDIVHPIARRRRRLRRDGIAAASPNHRVLYRDQQSIQRGIVSVHRQSVHVGGRQQQCLLGRTDNQSDWLDHHQFCARTSQSAR